MKQKLKGAKLDKSRPQRPEASARPAKPTGLSKSVPGGKAKGPGKAAMKNPGKRTPPRG